MVTPELITYVRSERANKVAEDLIRKNLFDNGWNPDDVNQVLYDTSSTISNIASQSIQNKPKSKSKVISCLLITIVLIVVITLLLIIFLALKRFFIIPLFTLPKSTQQMLSGQNCSSLPDLFQRNHCYMSEAFEKKDASLCEKIFISVEDKTSEQNKGLCYKNIARITHNPALCEKAGQFQKECLSVAK